MSRDTGTAPWPFSVLGLDDVLADRKTIRRAYARQLKSIDQATEIEAFEELRTAFEVALQMADALATESEVPFEIPDADLARIMAAAEAAEAGAADAEQGDAPESVVQQDAAASPRKKPEARHHPDPMDALCAQVATRSIVETDRQRLLRILGDPLLDDFQNAERLEPEILGFLEDLVYFPWLEDPAFPEDIDHVVVAELDRIYGWIEFNTAFQERTGIDDDFQEALIKASGIRDQVPMQAQVRPVDKSIFERLSDRWNRLVVRTSGPKWWVRWGIFALVMLIVSKFVSEPAIPIFLACIPLLWLGLQIAVGLLFVLIALVEILWTLFSHALQWAVDRVYR